MKDQNKKSGSRRPKLVEPPPIPYSSFRSDSFGCAALDDVFFTDSLIRFLIVNFSLLAVLLAANILIVLRAESIRVSGSVRNSANGTLFSDQVTMVHSGPNSQTENSIKTPSNRVRPELDGVLTVKSLASVSGQRAKQRVGTRAQDSPRNMAFESSDTIDPAQREACESCPSHASDAKGDEDGEDEDGEDEDEDGEDEDGANGDEQALLVSELDPKRRVNTKDAVAEASAESVAAADTLDGGHEPKPSQPQEPYYGTGIKWNRSIKEAARTAEASNKPIFLMHVSGNFTKEDFT